MTLDEQEAMLATVGWQIDWGGVKPPKRSSPRKGISRYESTWPGQSATCSVCGALMFSMGAYLRCSKSFPHLDGTCWNHVQAPIAPMRDAIVQLLMAQCKASEEFRGVIVSAATRQFEQQRGRSAAECDGLKAKVKDLETQERNLRRSISISDAVAEEGLTALVHDLAAVTKQLNGIRTQLASTQDVRDPVEQLTADEIMGRLGEVLSYLLRTSFEMAEVMRKFVPRCAIVPVQAHNGGQVYARAKLSVRLNLQNYDDLTEVVVDLFEPPLYIRILHDAVKLRSQTPQPTLKQIGAQLDVSYMSVKRALGYAKAMQGTGGTEVFRELREKPVNAARWREAS